MTPKRGDRVAPPSIDNEWHIRFADNTAAKGWDDLCSQVPGATRTAWHLMLSQPRPVRHTSRHHRLKGTMAYSSYRGDTHEQWQIEVTGGGRIWYLTDMANRTCWVTYAGTAHPKATE